MCVRLFHIFFSPCLAQKGSWDKAAGRFWTLNTWPTYGTSHRLFTPAVFSGVVGAWNFCTPCRPCRAAHPRFHHQNGMCHLRVFRSCIHGCLGQNGDGRTTATKWFLVVRLKKITVIPEKLFNYIFSNTIPPKKCFSFWTQVPLYLSMRAASSIAGLWLSGAIYSTAMSDHFSTDEL